MARKKKPALVNGLQGPGLLMEWRRRTNTSRQKLAEAMGLKDSASIWQYEMGRLPFTYARLVDLQRVTGISIWELAWPGQTIVMRQIVATREGEPIPPHAVVAEPA